MKLFKNGKIVIVSINRITFKLSQVQYIEPLEYPFRSPINLNARKVEPLLHPTQKRSWEMLTKVSLYFYQNLILGKLGSFADLQNIYQNTVCVSLSRINERTQTYNQPDYQQ